MSSGTYGLHAAMKDDAPQTDGLNVGCSSFSSCVALSNHDGSTNC